MKPGIFLMIALILFVFPLDSVMAKDDKALRKQRQEANKERQQQKRDRSAALTDANRMLNDFIRSQKADYQQQVQDLNVEFELRQVELKAERDTKMAAVEAEYQKHLMGLMTGTHDSSPEGIKNLQEEFKKYSDENFRLKREAAELEQKEKIANQKLKNDLLDKRDQEILDEAESLGLSKQPEPILATPIGGELTSSEKSWNDREKKEVVRIFDRHMRTLRDYKNGKAIRDWELKNMEEDFALKWDEKAELHKVQAEQMLYNSLMMSAAQGQEANQQDIMADLAELGKQTKLIRIKYAETNKKNQIKRRQERKALREK